MKSFKAFRLIIDLISMMWNALRGRPAVLEQKESSVAPGEDSSDGAKWALHRNEPKKVITASEPIATREAAVTATIYIDSVDGEPADEGADREAWGEAGDAETDLPGVAPGIVVQEAVRTLQSASQTAHAETDDDESTKAEAAAAEIERDEVVNDEGEKSPLDNANNRELSLDSAADQVHVGRENGHIIHIDSASETVESSVSEADDLTAAAPGEKMPDELFIDLNGERVALTALLESLLFVSDAALEPGQVAKVLPCTVEQIEMGLQRLRMVYHQEGRGLRVQERGGRYLLVTMPVAAPVIESFLNLDLDMRLSGPALEALAVIAYRQPVTRSQIEAVRGVDCGHVLRVLLQHELIEEVGRLETVGRPILYGVTDRFLQHFGLTSMNELPKLETDEADMLWAATQLAGEMRDSETESALEA